MMTTALVVMEGIIPCSGCGSFRERSGRFLGWVYPDDRDLYDHEPV